MFLRYIGSSSVTGIASALETGICIEGAISCLRYSSDLVQIGAPATGLDSLFQGQLPPLFVLFCELAAIS